jgi:2-dehydro-3-deoxyphosphogluconate aldolase/(4S)-4-hydroxy-2-oxoglutarate aldolase
MRRNRFNLTARINPKFASQAVANLQSSMDDLAALLARAPAIPTLMPVCGATLSRYAAMLAEERFPALEVLARPVERLVPALREVFSAPERLVVRWGVGTVTTRAVAIEVVRLQPDFLVSPAFSKSVLQVAVESGIPYIPGVATLQDVQNVVDAFEDFGLRVLKLCPVFHLSTTYVEALAGCFPGIRFCPTGEITIENFQQWAQSPAIMAPMGGALIPVEFIESQREGAFRERSRLLRRLSPLANS